MEMGISSFLLVILIPISVCAIAKKYSYYVKMTIFAGCCGVITTIALPFLLLRPRDYRNAIIPAYLGRWAGKLINVTMEIKGLENINLERGGVVLINHQSVLDVLVLSYLWPVIGRATVVAKIEVFYIPIFGLASYLWGTLFINRKNRTNSVVALSKESKAITQQNAKLLIFPEGSRNEQENLLPFKKGAFHIALDAKCPLQPVVISKYYFMDIKTKRFDKGHAIIHILPEFSTNAYSKDNIQDLMDDCRNLMQKEYSKLSRETLELAKCGRFG